MTVKCGVCGFTVCTKKDQSCEDRLAIVDDHIEEEHPEEVEKA